MPWSRDTMAIELGEELVSIANWNGLKSAGATKALEARTARSSTGYHEAFPCDAGKDRLEAATSTND